MKHDNHFGHNGGPQDSRKRRSRHGFDPTHGLARELGFEFGPGGRGRPRGRRRGGRGGDVRAAALLLLAEEPRHGYDLIQVIAERSEGTWSPSPGSIYPVLQQLEDEGLVEFERVDGRKTASLTPDGLAYVEEHREEFGTPWEQPDGLKRTEETKALAQSLKSFLQAWRQVAGQGTPEQQSAAAAAVDDARKALYGILAE